MKKNDTLEKLYIPLIKIKKKKKSPSECKHKKWIVHTPQRGTGTNNVESIFTGSMELKILSSYSLKGNIPFKAEKEGKKESKTVK